MLVPLIAGCTTVGCRANDRDREQLVQAVEKHGGQVLDIDWEPEIESEIENAVPRCPDSRLPESRFSLEVPHISLGAERRKWSKKIFGDIDFVVFGDFFDLPGSPNREVIDDNVLEKLARLPARNRIRSLYLEGTSVTDAGVKSLAKFRRLKHVDLRNTRVTANGVREFNLALPNCTVEM